VRTMIFTTLVGVQLVHAYAVRARHTGRPQDGPGRNRLLLLGALASFALHLVVVYVPLGQTLFDTEPLPAIAWPVVAALTLASFTVVSMANRWLAVRNRTRSAVSPS